MNSQVLSLEVPALLSGVRVDRGVSMLANVSRSVATELIAAGRVLVDDVAVTVGRTVLREGARLTVELPDSVGHEVQPEEDV
jgi:23S rRNA pseudouridine1911/1915/1917 synthase